MRTLVVIALVLMVLLANSCKQTTEIELQSGLNTVIYTGCTMAVEEVIKPIVDDVETISYWTGSTWLVHAGIPSDDLSTLVNGQTYVINMRAARTWREIICQREHIGSTRPS